MITVHVHRTTGNHGASSRCGWSHGLRCRVPLHLWFSWNCRASAYEQMQWTVTAFSPTDGYSSVPASSRWPSLHVVGVEFMKSTVLLAARRGLIAAVAAAVTSWVLTT